MPTITSILKQGAFDGDVAGQINTSLANINIVLGAATTAAPTGTGTVVLSTSPTIVTPTLTNPTMTTPTLTAPVLTGPTLGVAAETGANTALVATLAGGPVLATGLVITIQLGHTLQAGANTLNYNATGVKSILSHLNTANNLGTAYAATGLLTVIYNGTAWLDISQ